MYISPFWGGFVIGFVAAMVLITAWALWYGKRDKK